MSVDTRRARAALSGAAVPITRRSALALLVAALMAMLAFGWPLLVLPDAAVSGSPLTPLVFALTVPVILVVVLVQLAESELDAKALAMLGVMTAVVAAVRPLGPGTAGVETVWVPIILAARVYGPGFGFVLGNTGLFCSALLTAGVGPWLPFQMLAAAFMGLFAGLLPRASGWREVALLVAYALPMGFAYGWLTDFAYWPFALGGESQLSFDPQASVTSNLHRFVLFNLATSMGWNLVRSLSTAILLVLLAAPVLRILRRAARRSVVE